MGSLHISAEHGEIAESILLPGDPLRARYIAEHFLDDAAEVTAVRNMFGYTGFYRGGRVSVMGTGMGLPSSSIYITELIAQFGVQRMVRVGSCGAVAPDVHLRDIVLALGACTDSLANRARYQGHDFAATADFGLLNATHRAAEVAGVRVRVGNVHSGEMLYRPDRTMFEAMTFMGVLAAEMEAAGLYALAAQHRVKALTILTVSNHIGTGEELPSDDRETTFNEMVTLALEGLALDGADETRGEDSE
jgi:purine-nucleoside phosphorylase